VYSIYTVLVVRASFIRLATGPAGLRSGPAGLPARTAHRPAGFEHELRLALRRRPGFRVHGWRSPVCEVAGY